MREPGWVVVLPVKRLREAKTRLRGAVIGAPHEQLVLAMAQDTVRAAQLCPVVFEVLVVTGDEDASAALSALGARIAPDVSAGLNQAVANGALAASPVRWVAAVTADLPALRPEELASGLQAAARAGARGFVPDAAGTGTTLLAAPPGVALGPRFGPGSAARHAASGARRLEGDWPSVRCDVDTAADLAEAERLGLGPYTACVVRQIATSRTRGPCGSPRSRGSVPAPVPDG